MNGVVFAAILIDRLRISMRICAIAAAAVLVLEPASLAGVSFQMSFGAVVALIAVYETWGGSLARLHRGGFGRKVLAYCGGIAVTTVVATIGTEPFSIYHFHKLVLYSPLANVIAVPISALWTLPCGVIACLLMPFGLERLALVPMGWGIDATIWVAEHVSAVPGNIWTTPRLPAWGIVLVAFGGLWLALWQGKWRLGRAGDGGRPGLDAADPATRHRDQRSRPLCRRARPRRQLLRRRRHWRAHRPQPLRRRDAGRAAALAGGKCRCRRR
jgi:competence protein ComEC